MTTLAATTNKGETLNPELRVRENIDRLLTAAGWAVQGIAAVNLHVARGVAIREFPLNPGHGFADYLLYVDAKACGVIEARYCVEVVALQMPSSPSR